jgi:putative transposase
MPRANRHYIPGYVWHITHRCHKKEFLLKFSKDRASWLYWLYEARKRYGLSILNYIVTSNHVHLLIHDTHKEVIPRSMQLIAGRTGQEYNLHKSRKGAFWKDRYHATAIQTGRHLMNCMTYIDLNMVRAGVVKHPCEWKESGYQEIMTPLRRYSRIDHVSLFKLLGIENKDEYRQLMEVSLRNGFMNRESSWTESIAVGSRDFIAETKTKLASMAAGREILEKAGRYELREQQVSYSGLFDSEKGVIRLENTYFWNANISNAAG